LDKVAIKQDKDKNYDSENNRLRNVSSPVGLYDAVYLKYLQTKRINVIHFTGKLLESNLFKINNLDYFKFLYDGQVLMIKTSPEIDLSV
jgi:hypothetical protein